MESAGEEGMNFILEFSSSFLNRGTRFTQHIDNLSHLQASAYRIFFLSTPLNVQGETGKCKADIPI